VGLQRITLRDFVIVRQLELELQSGFTVLTGETGAGKSILIDALQLALGARSDTGLIREGAARTEVSVEFDAIDSITPWLQAAGFETSELLLLRRTVDTQGKSRAWINGSPATAAQLRELGDKLVDIHGQHAWQSLTRPDAVRGLMDAYAGVDTGRLHGLWEAWRGAQAALQQARAAQDSLQTERDRLNWQVGELEKLEPGQHEWEDLCAAHTRLANAQTLLDATQQALLALEEEDTGALSRLSAAQDTLRASEHLEPEFTALGELLASLAAQAQDAVHSLRSYQRRTDLDPEGLAQLDARMSLWMSLARRYKRAPAELAQLLSIWREALARLNASSDLVALEQAATDAEKIFLLEARSVTRGRTLAAPKLGRAISLAMQGLGMQGGRFEVQLQTLEQPCANGLEEISFLVAGHAGSTPRPVGKVASGGELSRIALAIAVTTSQLGSAQTLIFDEVDAGVGGAVAQTVGRLMRQLGIDRQVLAVTHLPQVAACADQHLVVAKQLQGQSTVSTVTAVVDTQRVEEIARMLGGQHLSETTRAHALEMLNTPQ
jgi:DNA repair protein RecN (Recombination protein N)